MKKLPKEKRNQLILVWLVIVGVVAGWAFIVLQSQLDAQRRAKQNLANRIDQHKKMTDQLKGSSIIEDQTEVAARKLEALEYQMADADTFSWVVSTLRDFNQSRNVDIPQKSQPSPGKNSLLPGFPYDEARLTVAGTAFFHDLGLFIADFENQFPFARITNVDMQPSSAGDEKLSFKMDIIFLVKPQKTTGRS